MRDQFSHVTAVLAALLTASAEARSAGDPESAVSALTRAARACLGDPEARLRPGALKPGERDFGVSGIFFAAPARDHLILIAEHDFPPEQHRLRISMRDSRPGYVVRTGEAVVLPNTDQDTMFRQILSTARMGSALYAPVVWRGTVLGMFNVAAQARNTYDRGDLDLLLHFADLAAAVWVAQGGPDFLARLADSLPPWQEPDTIG